MPEIITNEWINSKDLVTNGKPLLRELTKTASAAERKLNRIERQYGELLRTQTLTEAEQVAAKESAQALIFELSEEINLLASQMATISTEIGSTFGPAITSLLDGYGEEEVPE